MSKGHLISIADDFSKFPAGRYVTDGPFPGEVFRRRFLVPALNNNERVTVDLNGTSGFGSSFLEEAFGGLVREEGFKSEDVLARLTLISADQSIINEILGYINAAAKVAA